jgi:low temperature requirement protein LtrA
VNDPSDVTFPKVDKNSWVNQRLPSPPVVRSQTPIWVIAALYSVTHGSLASARPAAAGTSSATITTQVRIRARTLGVSTPRCRALWNVRPLRDLGASDNPTWEGLGQGMLVLALLWWAWGAYAWLTNYIAAEEGLERLLMFGAMGAFLVAALAVPHAFDDDALLFAVAYTAARWLHIFIFAEANEDIDAAGAIRRLARTAVPAPALLIVGALLGGPAQTVLWIIALAIDFAGPFVFGVRGFQVSAGHFAERFALIVIIALGESIVAIAAGLTGAVDAGVIAAALLGLVVACGLWWAYFDVVALVAESRFRRSEGYSRLRIARDSYSYLHLPMIAGIVLVALGVKKTIGDVDHALKTIPAVALFGGIALYYAGHIGFRLRNVGSVNRPRTVALVACLAAIPLAAEVDALAALGVAAAITSAVIVYETTAYAEARARIRREHAA